jgi:N-acetylglucosamine-6-phosphate deacetylase
MTQTYALTNCDIYTGETVEYDKALVISGDRIQGLMSRDDIPAAVEQRNLHGLCVAPGFIDVQVNGGGGVLFNDLPDIEGIRRIAAAHQRFGTTDLLPTFITGPADAMWRAARAVEASIKQGIHGVLGIHFEGPFISQSKAGVHDKRFIRSPKREDLEVICSLGRGITLVTCAPEVVPKETINMLVQRGIRVSLGHTDATYEQAVAAFDAGATCATHLYNAMSGITSRAPGVVGASLDHAGSWAGIIVDGFHADFAAVRIAIRAKARRKSILVTDAMPAVGTDGKSFRLGDYNISVDGGRCVTEGGVLAGSALDMATAVRNCVQKVGLPKDEALRMASTYPAAFLSLDSELGRIAPGFRANLVVFNNQIQVAAVVVGGEFQEVA